MQEHTIIKWLSIAVGIITLASIATGIGWFLQDQKTRDETWFREDIEWNAELLTKLDTVIQNQNLIIGQQGLISLRLEEVEEDQRQLLKMAYQLGYDVASAIGRREGQPSWPSLDSGGAQ